MGLNHIKLERRELTWEHYECAYYDTDWAIVKEFTQRQAESGNEDAKVRWEAIKDVTFEELMAMFNGDKEVITWEIHSNWNDYAYKESITELVVEWMRDEAWENGSVATSFADESYEDMHVVFETEPVDFC